MTDIRLATDWKELLKSEFSKPYFLNLIDFVKWEYASSVVFPPAKLIFAALDSCPLANLKVVILGQDPYHTPGVANGLAFSANSGNKVPPSLQNIYKEIQTEYGGNLPNNPDLTPWAKQGVLLLNTTLTVRQGEPMSHKDQGWETFTDAIISQLNNQKNNLVFLLWGAHAQKKEFLIDTKKHLILKSAHPSPFSANNGFFGNNHFLKTNQYLKEHCLPQIVWTM